MKIWCIRWQKNIFFPEAIPFWYIFQTHFHKNFPLHSLKFIECGGFLALLSSQANHTEFLSFFMGILCYQRIASIKRAVNTINRKEYICMGQDKESSGTSRKESQKEQQESIRETGSLALTHRIYLLSIIGEIEGHECLPSNSKTTKYEHILPKLAAIEDSSDTDGLLLLLNTVGGDVEAGLAIAEMIASLSKPTVSLVLGGSHSIGVPIAVSTDYSFIVPSGTMVIHPVRMSGTVIGAPQTYDYFKQMQDRILGFISTHSRASRSRLEDLMLDTGILTKDLGTILVGEDAVREGLIREVGGICQALTKLYDLIAGKKREK